MHCRKRQRHNQRFFDNIQRPDTFFIEFPDLEIVAAIHRLIGSEQKLQLHRERQAEWLETSLAHDVDRRRDLAFELRQCLLRIGKTEAQLARCLRFAPTGREFIRVQRLEITLDNRCELLQISDFNSKINNLSTCRQFLRSAAVSQRIAHGARMIRTRRAPVKVHDQEKARSAPQRG